jgi:hypothetical protein
MDRYQGASDLLGTAEVMQTQADLAFVDVAGLANAAAATEAAVRGAAEAAVELLSSAREMSAAAGEFRTGADLLARELTLARESGNG